MKRVFPAFVMIAAFFCFYSCDKTASKDTEQKLDAIAPVAQQNACTEIIKLLGEKWQCKEVEAMNFMLVQPEVWPTGEKERRARILEIARRASTIFPGKAFGVSVEFGNEKVKAEYLPENGRALSEYSAFGLTWQDIDEFDLLEEEQRIELEEETSIKSNLRHYVRVRNRSKATIVGMKTRSCIAFGEDEHCVDNQSVEDLAPDKVALWSLEMGPMKSPDVRAWYEANAADGRRVMAYRQYPNNLYKTWVGMLRETGEYFISWDERGEDPQRMIHSKWTVAPQFTTLEPAQQKAEAAKHYERIFKTLEMFLPSEQLKKEINIAINDADERLLFNYGSEAVN